MFKFIFVLVLVVIISGCSSHKENINTDKPDIPNYVEKRALGIDFFAAGNDPYWSLNMDVEDSTTIFLLNPYNGVIKFLTPQLSIDTLNNIIEYRFNENNTLTINRNTCVNSISGEKNQFSVILKVDGNDYKGCGKYIIASKNPLLSQETLRLNDIWALKFFNGKEVNRKDFKEGIPMLELHLNDGRFYGKVDCNEIHGNIDVGDSYINLTNFYITKKECEGNFENDYLNIIKSVDSWELNNMSLIFKRSGKEVLKYFKID